MRSSLHHLTGGIEKHVHTTYEDWTGSQAKSKAGRSQDPLDRFEDACWIGLGCVSKLTPSATAPTSASSTAVSSTIPTAATVVIVAAASALRSTVSFTATSLHNHKTTASLSFVARTIRHSRREAWTNLDKACLESEWIQCGRVKLVTCNERIVNTNVQPWRNTWGWGEPDIWWTLPSKRQEESIVCTHTDIAQDFFAWSHHSYVSIWLRMPHRTDHCIPLGVQEIQAPAYEVLPSLQNVQTSLQTTQSSC